MAVIRAGRTRLMKAGLIGAVIALIPAVIACGVLALFIVKKDGELESTNSKLAAYKQGTVCVLSNDVKVGWQLTNEDIKVVEGVFKEGADFGHISDYVGMYMKTDAECGTVLNGCIVEEMKGPGDDLSTYYIDYISIPASMTKESVFDIRLRFPNGEDYLVAENKKFVFCDEEGFFVDLTSREALVLSSAKVDCDIYNGAKLYAVFYKENFKDDKILTYPVNTYVFKLGQWEPNLSETFDEEMFEKREVLEKNLLEFMGVTNNMQ